MSHHITQHIDLIVPNIEDSRLAEKSSQQLASYLHADQIYTIQIIDRKKTMTSAKLPSSVLRLLVEILTEMGEGNAISLVPVHKELSTQVAADLLGVSRPYFVQLVEDGKIPFHKVGKHRRVFAKDVLNFKEKINKAREKSLNKLSKQTQKLNMGYGDEGYICRVAK